MEWFFATRTFGSDARRATAATTGVDDDFAARGFENIGAWILGRNMFGPVRGPWPDDELEGLVGRRTAVPRAGVRADAPRARAARDGGRHDVPLRHRRHPRGARAREGGGRRAATCALGGGVATIRQYLSAGLIDELHLAVSPVLLGSGEHLFAGIDLPELGYRCTEHVPTSQATHVVLTRA